MTQIFVDLSDATPAQLRDLAALLEREAERRDPELVGELLKEATRPDAPPLDPRVVFGQRHDSVVSTVHFNVAPPPPPPPSADNAAAGGATPFQTPAASPTVTPAAAGANSQTTAISSETSSEPQRTDATALSAAAVISDVGRSDVVPLDKAGFPHDPRIHSETPTLKKDGFWRQRRNLDNATLVAVEAELRAKGYGSPVTLTNTGAHPIHTPTGTVAPGATATVSLPPPPPPPVVPPGTSNASAGNPPPPPPPAAAVAPPPPPPVSLPVGTNEAGVTASVQSGADAFRQMMKLAEGHTTTGGKLSPEVMKPIHAEFGATGWGDHVGKAKAHVPAMIERIRGLLA